MTKMDWIEKDSIIGDIENQLHGEIRPTLLFLFKLTVDELTYLEGFIRDRIKLGEEFEYKRGLKENEND